PGVESTSVEAVLHMTGGITWGSITIEGDDPAAHGQNMIQAARRIAGSRYFETMNVRLVDGRFFNEYDTKDSPRVAIIDENMARAYWPAGDAVGKRFKMGSSDSTSPW